MRWLPFEIHPETPPEGAPKPFPPEDWPQVKARLEGWLETAELVRHKEGDGAAGTFYHDVSRAFFAQRAEISRPDVIGARLPG